MEVKELQAAANSRGIFHQRLWMVPRPAKKWGF